MIATLPEDGLPAVWVSQHALDRVHQHHPRVGNHGAREMVASAIEIDRGVAAELLQRRDVNPADLYLLASDRRGLLVVAPSRLAGSRYTHTLVTYLRFGQMQTALAERLYPPVQGGVA